MVDGGDGGLVDAVEVSDGAAVVDIGVAVVDSVVDSVVACCDPADDPYILLMLTQCLNNCHHDSCSAHQ